jgi:serine/threonine-protein kinase
LRSVDDPLIGKVLDGRFTIRERLGAGGMGAVYRAWQSSVGREVAIKVIEPKISRDLTASKRFLREAKLASQLSQPSIVTVLDFGQTSEGLLFLAMELVEGRTLGEALRSDGPFSPERLVRVAVQICDALEAAHTRDIIHRDLKPSNILILNHPPGRDLVKVLDFGLAKSLSGNTTTVTRSDMLVGTPLYLSPEIATGAEEDARADLYSLGVILYELTCGTTPFSAESINMLVAKHAYEAAPQLPAEVHPAIGRIVQSLLEKEPGRRFASAAATREALGLALEAARRDGKASASASSAVTPVQAFDKTRTSQSARPKGGPTPVGSMAFAQTVATGSQRGAAAPPKRRLALFAALIVAAMGAVAAFALLRGGGGESREPPAAVPTSTAGPQPATAPAIPDAAPPPAVDAGVPDAAAETRTQRRSSSSRRSSTRRPSRKPDAGVKKPVTEPELDYRLPD